MMFHWTVNPPTDSGPTNYIVMAPDEETARAYALDKCASCHRSLVMKQNPLCYYVGEVIAI